MRTPPAALAIAVLAAALLAPLAGCGGGDTVASRDAMVRNNPTPDLDTLYQRPIDMDNRMVLTFDENWRMFNQDWGRVWLTDRPSRLARERVPR
ncbi:MAG: hypothetical protein WD749_11360 [Phycisphaerales bacterium]